jgi:hypothetical protein
LEGTDWPRIKAQLNLADLPAFLSVAYIHAGTYLGGIVGMIAAVIYLRATRTPGPAAPPTAVRHG